MLQRIRDRVTAGPFAIVVLALIAISFGFFGVVDYNFLTAGNAAKVEDSEISLFQLENAYQNQLLNLSDYGSLPAQTRRLIKENALERLIRETLVERHVAGSGYRVGDEMIAEMIQSAPQFQENGVFKKELYYTWLDQNVMDARQFEAMQRFNIRTSQLQRGIGATAFVTPSEYRRYLNLFAEQRVVSLATFDIAGLADTIVVRDEDVQAYYDARPDDFMSPESVDFEYLEIDRDALADSIEISEEELAAYYESVSNRFRQDESRRASHILIPFGDDEAAAEEQATALTARAQAGEPFADLARQYSKDGGTAPQGGDLGTVLQSQMPGALGDAIFALDPGQIRGPVRTDFGFHVVKLDEVVPGGPLPIDQVRGELLSELRAQRVDDRARDLERQIVDMLFDAGELQDLAESTGLEVQSATGFTRSGGEPFGSNQAVIDTVFDPIVLTDRQISDVVDIDANRAIVVKVTDYHEESRKPLEEVKEDIVFALQTERAINIVEDRSRRLSEALQEGRDFEEMAFQLEANYTPSLTVTRVDEELDPVLLDSIFRTKKPSPGKARLGSVVTSEGDYAVFSLNAVVPGRPESIPLAERDARKESLQNNAGLADFNAFVNELKRNADIEINESAFEEQDF